MKAAIYTLALFGLSSNLVASCSDLYISEYIEGSSYNKAIEIYNPTTQDINLSSYSIELYSNGSSVATATASLSGTISSNTPYVISHKSAASEILAVTNFKNSSVINFNGDDAFVLKKDGVIIDSIGQIGVDPGSEWNGNSVSTKDSTLVKLDGVCEDSNPLDSYDPSLVFRSYTKDTFAYIGSFSGSTSEGENDTVVKLPITPIHDIQGEESVSTMIGQTVVIQGIVTADYQDGGFKGFYVQEEDSDWDENAKTSESVFVYCSSCGTEVNEGDLVKVEGRVAEYSNLTEIISPNVTVISSNNTLPSKTFISLPVENVSDLEAYEGMLVELNSSTNPLVIADNYDLGRYGSFTVSSERLYQYTQLNTPNTSGNVAYQEEIAKKSLVIDDGLSTQNPATLIYPEGNFTYENSLRAGYTISSIVGIMDERYSTYRIQPNSLTSIVVNTESNPRTKFEEKEDYSEIYTHKGKEKKWHKKKKDDELRTASFNVLNYFNTFENCTNGFEGESVNCRGANNLEEFLRQKTKIVNAMLEIDADVYGLMEIENDGYGENSALADLTNALNTVAGKDIYRYIDVDSRLNTTNALGLDAIKVAFIYNKNSVNPRHTDAIILDKNKKNRVTLAQEFKIRNEGKSVVITVNHFKSKGSACNGIFYNGIEDLDTNDGQGNCALTRIEAANNLVLDFENNSKFKKEKRIIHLGDFNSYAKENSLNVLEENGFTNAVTMNENLEKYSYVYYGQAGMLDHAFVSEKLLRNLKEANIWHINADEPKVIDYNTEYKSDEQIQTLYNEDVFRASDHDPVVLDFEF